MPTTNTISPNLQPIAEIDRAIHSPARLMILTYLAAVDSVDFTFLMNQIGLTRGNLSSHLTTLEKAGYISIKKEFVDRIPRTLIRLTDEGTLAIQAYQNAMSEIIKNLLH